MHIVIPMAGHSRRFREVGYVGPKAFLNIGNKLMIEHVVGMFSGDDFFHFVVNEDQVRDIAELFDILKSLAKNTSITVIPVHDLGPTHSALFVKDIPVNEQVIVTYCDFFVDWDYEKFKLNIVGYDAVAPAFVGFHPASYGKTLYAYMRVDDAGCMVELREKNSFTDDRTLEPASTGIYYFRSWGLFENYANRLMERDLKELPEAYISLVLNELTSDGLKVYVPLVDRFICLGTPDDVSQYIFWYRYFSSVRPQVIEEPRNVKRIGLIPMAGRGSRFRDYGYRVSKPLIRVGGRPMVLRAAEAMPAADEWIFAARSEDIDRHSLDQSLKEMFPFSTIFRIEGETSGAAATCLMATETVSADAELTIASCDYECRFDPVKWQEILNDTEIDGAVWTFRTGSMLVKSPEAFAYCRVTDDGRRIIELVEKQTISSNPERDHAVIGTFWFRRASDFRFCAQESIERDIRVNGEHYVGNSINHLIAAGKKFVIFEVEQWISFGDPFELQVYEYWEEHFHAH